MAGMLIPELIDDADVDLKHDDIWCWCQYWWRKPPAIYLTEGGPTGIMICTAHVDRGQVYTCGEKKLEETCGHFNQLHNSEGE